MAIYICLGDLHGQVATLERLRAVQARYPEAITVFIGDYIDCYGENSGFELIEQIRAMQQADPRHVVVLMGNHEQAAVDFFDDEWRDAWLRFGGRNTLTTAGISVGGNQDVRMNRQLLLERKAALIDWMRALPLTYAAEKLFCVHAGLDLMPELSNQVQHSQPILINWSSLVEVG
ncbi:metallophosphoesterase family protein [Levilactobacillus sp. 244-2]|uniref:metallophosphoesterase family protein n=1 Tax=Levilactobacillus sp. 244-2 TaxID=2799569 RepID=UPI00194E022D|nr:metallophosphoesterase family protein [Levilactobacillus sp. 244-2]